MSKTIESTIKGFEGKVTFYQPLTLDQVLAFEDAKDLATEAANEKSAFWTAVNTARGEKDENGEIVKMSWGSRSDRYFIAAFLKCVEVWEIPSLPQPLTVETFPMTPRMYSRNFIDLLYRELEIIYNGETEIPNES